MKVFINVAFLAFMTMTRAVLEQDVDDQGNIVWKPGNYRNRNVVPKPSNFDASKKHKREIDVEDDDSDDIDTPTAAVLTKPSKKSFIRTHFSIPLGAEFPLGYSEKVQHRSTKKSVVFKAPLEEKLAGEEKYNLLHVKPHLGRSLGLSDVPKTWGLTWKVSSPKLETYRESKGYGRSTLEGISKDGKISEDEFDSGLMGRGLGGMKERAQNENLMEQKFADKIEDESDVENEHSRIRIRRFIFFPPYFHHYHHHHQYHDGRRRRYPPPQDNQHPPHPVAEFPAANNTAAPNENNSPQSLSSTISSSIPVQSKNIMASTQQSTTVVTVNNPVKEDQQEDNADSHQRQFKQVEEGRVKGAQGGDSLNNKETNAYEYQPQFGVSPDLEYDKDFPNGVDGLPYQYMNHNPHHNVFTQHGHAPYMMHPPHDDYKTMHPAHAFETKMQDIVKSNYNFTTPLLDANKIQLKRTKPLLYDSNGLESKKLESTPQRMPARSRLYNFRNVLKHFLFIGGKIPGRHIDQDLSPVEVINWRKR